MSWRVLVTSLFLAFSVLAFAKATRPRRALLPGAALTPQAEMEAIALRVRQWVDYVAEADRVAAAQQERWAQQEQQVRIERETLNAAAVRFLDAQVRGAGEALAKRKRVPQLVDAVIAGVEARVTQGQWVPLSRAKAPAFLLAVSFHESSWDAWDRGGPTGARGERCSFQVHPSTLWALGFTEAQVAADFRVCLTAAIRAMETCAQSCGSNPAEGFMSCYATGGSCSGARDVVDARFRTARQLLAAQ